MDFYRCSFPDQVLKLVDVHHGVDLIQGIF